MQIFYYSTTNDNVLGLRFGDYYSLIDKTIKSKERITEKIWLYNYSYTISIIGFIDEPYPPNHHTINQDDFYKIISNSRILNK